MESRSFFFFLAHLDIFIYLTLGVYFFVNQDSWGYFCWGLPALGGSPWSLGGSPRSLGKSLVFNNERSVYTKKTTKTPLKTNISYPTYPLKKPTKVGRWHYTLPETSSSPLKIGLPNRKVVFQPSIFRSYVSFREGIPFEHMVPCF